MISRRVARICTCAVLVALAVAGVFDVVSSGRPSSHRIHVVAYFDNSNGIFAGDEIRILGVPVGEIEKIEPQPQRAKISFWIDDAYKVPADALAMILAPQLVTARAIQLSPAYTGGPVLADGAVIPQSRTAVPVEWDDVRKELQKLTDALQPTEPGGVSTFGAIVNTAADNLRGQGSSIRDALIRLSQAVSILGDHSKDIFLSVKHLSTLVSALQASTELMQQLNRNLSAASGLLANDPGEVGQAIHDLNAAVADVQGFVADNHDAVGTTAEKLASVSTALTDSLGDIKQALHVAPNTLAGLSNVYQPAQGSLSGALALNDFADPISFLCGAIQAASRLNNQQSSKLCVQYLAPIVKNRQYNFPPFGMNMFVGTQARPNEVTYSEDWMRPDHLPPYSAAPQPASGSPELAAEAPPTEGENAHPSTTTTDPAAGLPGMMVPPGSGAGS